MAKIIRCPNCGENVEVPPNPTGQMVTCIACGTVLRLKSKKDASRDPAKSDAGGGSLSGQSMSATTVVQQNDRSSDDPPSLGSECDVCGQSFDDPSDLVEDRGRLTCRACMKKSGGAIAGASASAGYASRMARKEGTATFDFADAGSSGPRRGKMFTFGPPFFTGAFAAILVIACNVYLAVFPKPVGSKTVAIKEDTPAPSTESKWDTENRPTIERMMSEAAAMKADQNRLADAKAKYDAVVAMAKGQAIGAQDVRHLVDLAEQESEALRVALTPTTPAPTAPPQPAPAPAVTTAPPAPTIEVPDSIAPKEGSVFDDVEVAITDKLNSGMTSLEQALAQPGEPAANPAKDALLKFSEARALLIKEKRNVPEDPGWSLSNHGTAVAYLLLRNYGFAMDYLDRLPKPPDRAAIINRVVVLLQMRENKAEAIQMLLGFLRSDEGADDTYALNLLGTTLARYSDDVVQKDKALSDAQAEYTNIVKKLGAKHPGEKRWGIRWIPQGEYEANLKTQTTQKKKIDLLEQQLVSVRGTISRNQNNTTPRGKATLAEAQTTETRITGELDKLRTDLKVEEWLTPEQILPVLPDVTAVNARSQSKAATKAAAG